MIIQYLVVIFIFLILFLFFLIKKWQRGKLEKYAPLFFEPKYSNLIFYPKISGLFNNIHSEVSFIPRSKNTPPKVKISIDYKDFERWKIKKKLPFDIDFSLLPKIKTNNPFLDENFIVRAKSPEFLYPIINDPRKLERIMKIFGKKEAVILEAKKRKLYLWFVNLGISNLQMQELSEILEDLVSFSL